MSISLCLLAVLVACQVALVLGDCQNISSCSNSTVACDGGLLSLNDSDYIQLPNDTVLYNNHQFSIIQYEVNATGVAICPSLGTNLTTCSTNLTAIDSSEVDLFSPDGRFLRFNGAIFTILLRDANGDPVVCPSETVLAAPPVEFVITQSIVSSLSVIGSVLVLVTYGLFKSLRTLPSLILMNLSAATLAIDLISLFRLTGVPISNMSLCTVTGIFLYFFGISQFIWMSIMSIQLAKIFRAATKMEQASRKNNKAFFAIYLVIGWGTPLLLTTIVVIVNFTTEFVQFGVRNCWISHVPSHFIALFVPLGSTLLINIVCSVVVTVFICQAIEASRRVSKLSKQQNLVYFRLNIAAFSVSGLTWVFYFIAEFIGQVWAVYPFTILFGIQGFVIFLAFVFTKRILKLYWNLFTCQKCREVKDPKENIETV